jgi:hypothetical protein
MWLYDPLPIWHAYRAAWWTLILLVVASCTPVNIHPTASNCVPIPTYSQEWQTAFADELDMIHARADMPHVEQYVVDSTRTRQALKACK